MVTDLACVQLRDRHRLPQCYVMLSDSYSTHLPNLTEDRGQLLAWPWPSDILPERRSVGTQQAWKQVALPGKLFLQNAIDHFLRESLRSPTGVPYIVTPVVGSFVPIREYNDDEM